MCKYIELKQMEKYEQKANRRLREWEANSSL